jgi:hypothetical protein
VKAASVLALAICAAPAFGQYAGPAILSRGDGPAAMATPQVDFRPFFELTGGYSTGLEGVTVNSQGIPATAPSAAVQISGGVSGVHTWKHTQIALNYTAALSRYPNDSFYDSSTQGLLFSLTHQFTRHAVFSLRENAGMYWRTPTPIGLSETVPFDASTTYAPATDFYDNRTMFTSTQANFRLQKSNRLSFDLGGNSNLTRRQSTVLYGVGGVGAQGDVQYRWTRRSTIGAAYSYMHFAYRGVFSASDIHSVNGTYAIQLTRTLELSAFGGFSRVETKIVQAVPVNPEIGILLGISEGAVIIHTTGYRPNFSARLSRTFSRGVAFLSGGHSETPGNGLFLMSSATNAAAGYTFTGLRLWSFSAQAAYSTAESTGNVLGRYTTISGGLSASRQIRRYVHVIATFSARQYESPDFAGYNRFTSDARLGLGFTPGDIPLRIW